VGEGDREDDDVLIALPGLERSDTGTAREPGAHQTASGQDSGSGAVDRKAESCRRHKRPALGVGDPRDLVAWSEHRGTGEATYGAHDDPLTAAAGVAGLIVAPACFDPLTARIANRRAGIGSEGGTMPLITEHPWQTVERGQ
jgi:hypothetical protein